MNRKHNSYILNELAKITDFCLNIEGKGLFLYLVDPLEE